MYLQKVKPFLYLGIFYLIVSFLLRLVFVFHPITTADFSFAEDVVLKYALGEKMAKPVIVQPAFGQLEGAEVGEWVKNSPTRFRLGLQLHKFLYEPTLRAV